MNATGITERLIKFARLLTGWLAGGLGQVSIALSLMMGGISGSAVADTSMETRLLGPSMISQGEYSKGAAAVLAFGSIITATIPPIIGLILFGFINEVSIGRLFLGVKTEEFTKAAAPYFLATLAFITILVAFPTVSLFLPIQLM